jgi:hypothetical protein
MIEGQSPAHTGPSDRNVVASLMSHASARRGSCYADGWDSGPAVEAMGWVGERLAIASVDRIDGPLLNYMSRESVGARKRTVRWWQCNDVEVTKTLRSRELLPRSCYPASTTVGFLGTGRPSPSLYPRQPRTLGSMSRPAFRLRTIRTGQLSFLPAVCERAAGRATPRKALYRRGLLQRRWASEAVRCDTIGATEGTPRSHCSNGQRGLWRKGVGGAAYSAHAALGSTILRLGGWVAGRKQRC